MSQNPERMKNVSKSVSNTQEMFQKGSQTPRTCLNKRLKPLKMSQKASQTPENVSKKRLKHPENVSKRVSNTQKMSQPPKNSKSVKHHENVSKGSQTPRKCLYKRLKP